MIDAPGVAEASQRLEDSFVTAGPRRIPVPSESSWRNSPSAAASSSTAAAAAAAAAAATAASSAAADTTTDSSGTVHKKGSKEVSFADEIESFADEEESFRMTFAEPPTLSRGALDGDKIHVEEDDAAEEDDKVEEDDDSTAERT